MNRREFLATGGAGLLVRQNPARVVSSAPRARGTDREISAASEWAGSFARQPPFSFLYGSRTSADLLPKWKRETRSGDSDGARHQQEVSYTDAETGLVVRAVVTTFQDFPAVEWVLYFKNTGAVDTPIMEDIRALDTELRSSGGDPVIHYAKGATCSMDDYMPLRRVLNAKGRLHVQPGGGRSSSDFLPFFNIELEGAEGVVLGIGWSGEWAATFTHEQGPEFKLKAGMAQTRLKLHPGEEIRTPLILMLFWQGGRLRGHNLLRQFILSYHRPKTNGKPAEMPICNGNWGATPAARHLDNIRKIAAHKLPIDYYWIDAEWFGTGPWWTNAGDWRVKQDYYPEGFKPISDLLHRSGLKLLLWFEPERVCEGTPWYEQCREWLLEVPTEKRVYNWGASQADPMWVVNESYRNQIKENDRLFNLGNPAARRFLTDFISSKIQEFGLDCYRHDANIAPLEFWRAADPPNRQGITEIRWIEGLYAFWDELLDRHPHLLIDNCASGGRRMDLESLSRSVPLWRTDFPRDNTAKQCHTYGLLHWVPLNSITAGYLRTENNYNVRSSMSSGLVFDLFERPRRPPPPTDPHRFPFDEIRATLEQYRNLQKYFYGDYYPLTQYSQAGDVWMAYQLDLPELAEGLVVVLKRPVSPFTHAAFVFRALQQTAWYEVVNLDSTERTLISGAELMKAGLEVHLFPRPASALFRYRRVKPPGR